MLSNITKKKTEQAELEVRFFKAKAFKLGYILIIVFLPAYFIYLTMKFFQGAVSFPDLIPILPVLLKELL